MMVVQILWGFILIGTGFANNFPTLIALRVILGAMEAPIVPGNFVSSITTTDLPDTEAN